MAGAVEDQDAGGKVKGSATKAKRVPGKASRAGKARGGADRGNVRRAAEGGRKLRGLAGAEILKKLSALGGKSGALFCLCLSAREAPDVDVWSSLKPERAECPALYRKCLAYLKSALEGFSSEKGIEARVDEIDSMIDMTGGADGSETLGDRIALSALELLHTGYDALEPEIGLEAMENAERLYLSLCEHALRGRELDDAQVEKALDYERSFLGALRMICQQLRPASAGGANARIIKMAVEAATEDGVSGAGIEAAQPAFA